MSDKTPLERAKEALRAAGFEQNPDFPEMWERCAYNGRPPKDLVVFDPDHAAACITMAHGTVPAVLAALRGETVALADVERAAEHVKAATQKRGNGWRPSDREAADQALDMLLFRLRSAAPQELADQ